MRILVSIDGGSLADVVKMGAYLSLAVEGVPTLLAVIKHETDRQRAEGVLIEAVKQMGELDRQPEMQIRIGQPAVEIVREAEENNFDLIVIGERPQLQLPVHRLRTNVERVADRSSMPVLFARGVIRPPKRVLVCEAGREPPVLKRLIDHLEPLLRSISEVTILHVMSQITAAPDVPGWELEADAAALIERHTWEGRLFEHDLERLKRLEVRLEAKVRHGMVVNEILAEAKSGDYDLLVIGAHKAVGWDRFLLDDLAHKIVTRADRPVLIV